MLVALKGWRGWLWWLVLEADLLLVDVSNWCERSLDSMVVGVICYRLSCSNIQCASQFLYPFKILCFLYLSRVLCLCEVCDLLRVKLLRELPSCVHISGC